MEDNLKFWQLRKRLTVHEATCLAFGIDPIRAIELERLPEGWAGFYTSLVQAATDDTIKYRLFNDLPSRDDYTNHPVPDLFFYELSTLSTISKLNVGGIKRWLTSEGIRPSFFFPEDQERKEIASGYGSLLKLEQTVMPTSWDEMMDYFELLRKAEIKNKSGATLVAHKHKRNDVIREKIREIAMPVVERGALKHNVIARQIYDKGIAGRLSMKFVLGVIKKLCAEMCKDDLIIGKKKKK